MNIEIQQPKPFDLVGNTILIAGNAVGFESHLSVHIGDGHFEVSGNAVAGSTSIRQFQASITIPDDMDFRLDQLTISVADDSAGGDGVPTPQIDVPVLYGPRILEGYGGYWEHEVVEGDTLSNLAREYYEDVSKWGLIHRANAHTIANPDVISLSQILRIPRVL